MLIFPSLPGRAVSVEREREDRVDELETVSARVQTFDWGLAPRHRFRLRCNFLRAATAHRELQRLAGFYAAHRGDTFLFEDPDDRVVTDHGFGVGDGTRTAFQLQRALDGDVRDLLGTWRRATKPRTNLVRQSGDLSVAPWGGTCATDLAAGIAPDGTPTAMRVRKTVTTQNENRNQGILTAGAVEPGVVYTLLIWVRADTASSCALGLYQNAAGWTGWTGRVVSGPGAFATVSPAVPQISGLSATEWTLVEMTAIGNSVGAALGVYVYPGLHTSTTVGHAVQVWLPHAERGQAGRPFATAATVMRRDPAYWPALGDGFEPVYEPDPRNLALWVDGDGLGRRALSRVARTNNVLHSQNLAEAGWIRNAITSVVVGATAPDGTSTAATITEDTTTNDHHVYRASDAVAGRPFVHSAYLKAGTSSLALIRTGSTIHRAFFDLSAGAVLGTPLSCVAGIEAVGGGWFRCWIAGIATAASAAAYVVGLAEAGPVQGYVGTSRTLLAWGAQSENDVSVAGDYIATTSAPVSRTDVALGANGAVTFAAAPRAGAALSWSGGFWRRCRFAAPRLTVERWLAEVYRAGIELVEDLP